jgi:protein tyrosine phosphatase
MGLIFRSLSSSFRDTLLRRLVRTAQNCNHSIAPHNDDPYAGMHFSMCTSVEDWLQKDPSNLALVHCISGKGRTAVFIACVLAWVGAIQSPLEALEAVAQKMGIAVDTLTVCACQSRTTAVLF